MIRARWFFHIHILANSEHSSAVGEWGGIRTCVRMLGGGVGYVHVCVGGVG